jgi:hypothetical protein
MTKNIDRTDDGFGAPLVAHPRTADSCSTESVRIVAFSAPKGGMGWRAIGKQNPNDSSFPYDVKKRQIPNRVPFFHSLPVRFPLLSNT